MPTSKRIVRARESGHLCEFCKEEIKRGEKYTRSRVRDRFGNYTLRRHTWCEHTAALNRVAERVFG